jgi:CubicO group peptidase (beta-lactamase class C family)
MLRKNTVPRLILLPFVTAFAAQADKTDDFIDAQRKAQNIPGLSLAVVQNGEITKAAGYGLANIKRQTPATPETVYKIASVSKQFIATGIMLLVQQGRVRLDDPVSKYLEGTPKDWAAINVRHLLTHTSGLVREAPGFDPSKAQRDADVIKTAYSKELGFAPGEKWEYCNLGYYALAEIISRASGRPWTEYLAETVFKPSGMNTTFPTNTKETLQNRAQGYADNDKLKLADDWAALRPSGGYLSTVLDLAKWDAVLYSDKILTADTRRQMWTPVTLNDGSSEPYGFGWELVSFRGRKLVHHSGGMPGARSEFARFVDDSLTIILLMNLDDVDVDSILNGVAALYLPESP